MKIKTTHFRKCHAILYNRKKLIINNISTKKSKSFPQKYVRVNIKSPTDSCALCSKKNVLTKMVVLYYLCTVNCFIKYNYFCCSY